MATGPVHVITEENFQDEVVESPIPVLLDFATAWCPPCRALAPVLHRLAAENEGHVKVGAVSADEYPSLAARFAVRGYPTVIVFSGGKERARHLGATSKEKLLQMVEACR
jgi:thioredoxin 1